MDIKKIEKFLIDNYSKFGKNYCMSKVKLREGQMRYRVNKLNLKVDKTTKEYKERQRSPLKNTASKNKFFQTKEWKEYSRKTCYWLGKKLTEKEKKEISKNMKKWHKEHPNHNTIHKKGFKFTKQQLKNISMGVKKSWKNKKSGHFSKKRSIALSNSAFNLHRRGVLGRPEYTYSRCKGGEFNDGKKKYYMRSRWERNYAWYLNFLIKHKEIKNWEYEVDTFWFKKIKRGVRSYKPDFKIFNNDNTIEYHEVKGYMDPKSKTKLKRIAKYYPKVKLILIDESVYNSIKKNSAMFDGWET